MAYYDHITALRLRTGDWAEPRPLRSHERELAEMAAVRAQDAGETTDAARRKPLKWWRWARALGAGPARAAPCAD